MLVVRCDIVRAFQELSPEERAPFAAALASGLGPRPGEAAPGHPRLATLDIEARCARHWRRGWASGRGRARGSELLVHLALGSDGGVGEGRVVAPPEPPMAMEAPVGLRFRRRRLHWFDGQTGKRVN